MGFNRRRSNAAKLGRRAHQWQARAWSVTKLELIAGANCAGSHRTDFGNVWNEMAQQVLNAVAQRRGRRRAAGTSAFHVEINDAILGVPSAYPFSGLMRRERFCCASGLKLNARLSFLRARPRRL